MTSIGDTPVAHQPHPAPDTGREERVHQSERTRVLRVRMADGGCVISKVPIGPGSLNRLRHESTILERLAGVAGVVQLAGIPRGADAIVLKDSGAVSLAEAVSAGPLDVAAVVDLALDLAGIVAEVHRRGVVHKDICPANIVVSGPDRRPVLIDFGLATTNALEQPGFVHHSEIAGTLAYLAPEQTGRTGRSVDQRADLYALGATLYELATGRAPFGTGDPLQLIHDHLARVPTAPADLDRRIPDGLSDIILRLLEKEPDRRYQSAEGLVRDMSRLRDELAAGRTLLFALGEHDFPLRLSPPSRLIGREADVAALRKALDDAVAGGGRGVLITGAPGVGKTALTDELRPIVTARGGWFVAGKFDQHRRDLDSDGVRQAFRGLGRLLLAEPESELAALRARILGVLGPNAGRVAAVLPEFALLSGTTPDVTVADPLDAVSRTFQAGLDLLHAIVSPARPLVIVVDDLQWAGANSIGFLDTVLTDGGVPGLLIVGAYRDAELDATHPLAITQSRWERLDAAPRSLRLENLEPADLATMIEEMLHLDGSEATRLAEAIGARTGGNPYDTLELVNALRRDGALVVTDHGWSWDEATIRRYVGQGDVVDLLSARIAALPDESRTLLEIMACLSGEVEFGSLGAASALSVQALEEHLGPPLEDGLLVMVHGGDGAVRFRHDRVQQAAYGRLDLAQRRDLHLLLARRLTALPEFRAGAAEQYLLAVDALHEPDERRLVADLFRAAAAEARLMNSAVTERFLAAALVLRDTAEDPADARLLAALETERHAALYHLGRLEDADAVYASIARRDPDPLDLAEAACVQVCSLANRGRPREAVALGLALLEQLGLRTPEDVGAAIFGRLDALSQWVSQAELAEDLLRPELDDPRMLAVAKLLDKTLAPALFSDPIIYAWLVLEGQRLWSDHGPCAPLVASLGATPMLLIVLLQDHAAAYRASRHALALGEARGYEPATSMARFMFALSAAHWFEPLENVITEAQRAREGLLQGGELQFACFSYSSSIPALLECAPTLESFAEEVEAGLALAARTGNDHATGGYRPYRQLLRALRGETDTPGGFVDGSFDEASYLAGLGADTGASAIFHVHRALSAAFFGVADELARHTAAAMPLLGGIPGRYATALAQLLRALALAHRAGTATPGDRSDIVAEFDVCRDWLAERAADAPGNFLHLLRLVDAERAAALDDVWGAVRNFDAAFREAEPRQRPWHRAFIAERAGLFHLAQGLEHTGRTLMAEARDLYQAWGATAKVDHVEREHPFLRVHRATWRDVAQSGSISVSSDAIDLLGILQASQALSSETNLDQIRARVVDVLSALTGATMVRVVLWSDDTHGWVLPSDPGNGGSSISVEDAGELGLLPLSAFRYVERTREALVVGDATRDDRFARDPYLAGMDHCSLLLVPIFTRGEPRAMLVLENQLSRSAFSAERLDAAVLIAGQLAVSLDNAHVYASLEHKVAERTEALAERTQALEAANERLEMLSVTDALTGLANRRQLADVLEAEWLRAMRNGTSLAAAMIDIDHFKLYNDLFGHIAGDTCLRRVATVLRDTMRQGTDLVARYGGEEFAVILPGADVADAYAAAERVRAAVVALDEAHAGIVEGRVTVSVGVAVTALAEGDAKQLLESADAALYEAKRNGRDRVMVAPTH
jgi:diguanylate cyclase (GGDEF)-like protein